MAEEKKKQIKPQTTSKKVSTKAKNTKTKVSTKKTTTKTTKTKPQTAKKNTKTTKNNNHKTKVNTKKRATAKPKTANKTSLTAKTNNKHQQNVNKPLKKEPIKKNISFDDLYGIIVLIILALVGIYLISAGSHTHQQSVPIKNPNEKTTTNENISKEVLDLDDINVLKEKYGNDDIKGLLYIPKTNIKEPITQSTDNDYYLKHDLYRNYEIQGTVFLDYRVKINEGRKNLIYSHNSHTIDVPFRELEGYYDKSYYDNHKYIYLKSEQETAKYQVFSIYVETSDWSYTRLTFETDEDWLNHLKQLKSKSWYETDVNIDENDQILILQTCSNLEKYENYDNKYLLIISKKVK